jgi:hypothetical protein
MIGWDGMASVRGLFTLACHLQFLGRCRWQASRYTLAHTWESSLAKQSKVVAPPETILGSSHADARGPRQWLGSHL